MQHLFSKFFRKNAHKIAIKRVVSKPIKTFQVRTLYLIKYSRSCLNSIHTKICINDFDSVIYEITFSNSLIIHDRNIKKSPPYRSVDDIKISTHKLTQLSCRISRYVIQVRFRGNIINSKLFFTSVQNTSKHVEKTQLVPRFRHVYRCFIRL